MVIFRQLFVEFVDELGGVPRHAGANADPALPDEHRLFRCRLLGRGRGRLPAPTAAVRKELPVLTTCADVVGPRAVLGQCGACGAIAQRDRQPEVAMGRAQAHVVSLFGTV